MSEVTWPADMMPKLVPFDLAAFKDDMRIAQAELQKRVLASKQQGNTHVDQLPHGVEAMRGCKVLSLWDGHGGYIENCDSFGRVWIRWHDVVWPIEGIEKSYFRVMSEPLPELTSNTEIERLREKCEWLQRDLDRARKALKKYVPQLAGTVFVTAVQNELPAAQHPRSRDIEKAQ
jgi:hypothetical protein